MAIYYYNAKDVIDDILHNGDIESIAQDSVDARKIASQTRNEAGCRFPEPISDITLGNILFTSLANGFLIGPFDRGDVSFDSPSWTNRMTSTVVLQLLTTREELNISQKQLVIEASKRGVPHFAELSRHGIEVSVHSYKPSETDLLNKAIRHIYGKEMQWKIRFQELTEKEVGIMRDEAQVLYDYFVLNGQTKFPFPELLAAVSDKFDYLMRVVDIGVDPNTCKADKLADEFPQQNVPEYIREYLEMVVRKEWAKISATAIAGRRAYSSMDRIHSEFQKVLIEKSSSGTEYWLSAIIPK